MSSEAGPLAMQVGSRHLQNEEWNRLGSCPAGLEKAPEVARQVTLPLSGAAAHTHLPRI